MKMCHQGLLIGLGLSLGPSLSFSQEVTVKNSQGEVFVLEIAEETPFQEAIEQIIELIEPEREAGATKACLNCYTLDFTPSYQSAPTILAQVQTRDYFHVMTPAEKADLRYILHTLATASWTKLLSSQSSLKRAGERIDHIHPLRFWQTIFSDEELKGCFHAVRDRKKIWKEFASECMASLERELAANNIKREYVDSFAGSLGLNNGGAIYNMLQARRWNDFFDTLIKQLPRTGNPDQYNM